MEELNVNNEEFKVGQLVMAGVYAPSYVNKLLEYKPGLVKHVYPEHCDVLILGHNSRIVKVCREYIY